MVARSQYVYRDAPRIFATNAVEMHVRTVLSPRSDPYRLTQCTAGHTEAPYLSTAIPRSHSTPELSLPTAQRKRQQHNDWQVGKDESFGIWIRGKQWHTVRGNYSCSITVEKYCIKYILYCTLYCSIKPGPLFSDWTAEDCPKSHNYASRDFARQHHRIQIQGFVSCSSIIGQLGDFLTLLHDASRFFTAKTHECPDPIRRPWKETSPQPRVCCRIARDHTHRCWISLDRYPVSRTVTCASVSFTTRQTQYLPHFPTTPKPLSGFHLNSPRTELVP